MNGGIQTSRRLALLIAATALLSGAAPAHTQSCTYGPSSMAVQFVDGHEVIMQPAHATGCTS